MGHYKTLHNTVTGWLRQRLDDVMLARSRAGYPETSTAGTLLLPTQPTSHKRDSFTPFNSFILVKIELYSLRDNSVADAYVTFRLSSHVVVSRRRSWLYLHPFTSQLAMSRRRHLLPTCFSLWMALGRGSIFPQSRPIVSHGLEQHFATCGPEQYVRRPSFWRKLFSIPRKATNGRGLGSA